MIKHFMILSSSYSTGQRIAMHYIIDDQMNPEMLTSEVKTIKELCGETVSISTHYVETESASWESVIDKDGFFEGVHVVETLVGFVNLISADRVLKGIDIAKYILATHICTHLELEKLVYMCYADYLCSTNKKLFEDKIYDAFSILFDIFNNAEKEIIIIDNFANKELLDTLKNIDKNIIIISKNIDNVLISKYCKQI